MRWRINPAKPIVVHALTTNRVGDGVTAMLFQTNEWAGDAPKDRFPDVDTAVLWAREHAERQGIESPVLLLTGNIGPAA